jgi:N-acyl-D-amino-acid deacylase
MDYDIVLRNGKVVDGSGNPWYRADVGIADGRIVAISRRPLGDAVRVLDVAGHAVCPGFINPHGHIGRLIHEDNVVLQSAAQGVTVECVGNCGMAVYTMSEEYQAFLQAFTPDLPVDWRSLEEWRARREAQGLGVNVAPFLGFGTIRASVMGQEGAGGERFAPSAEEVAAMEAAVAEGMGDGAFGVTVGLSYQVQRNAGTAEIIGLCRVAAGFGGVFMAHARGGAKSVAEFVEICERTPIPGCLSHATLTANPEAVGTFQAARARGVEVLFDLYPWTHGSGKNLGFWLFGHQLMKKRDPEAWQFWNVKDFAAPLFAETAARLRDAAEWRRIKTAAVARVEGLVAENEERRKTLEASGSDLTVPPIWDLASRVGIVFSPSHPEFEGDDAVRPVTLGEVATALGVEDIWEAARALFIADEGRTLVVNASTGRRERHVVTSYQLPEAIVSSDASIYITHPRAYGSWPKVLQRYVRELPVLRLEEAVRKMTSLPAQFLGLTDRGRLTPGMWADVVVVDPATVANRATYREPRRGPRGIPYVLVNGEVVVEDGRHTGALPGKVLARP